MLIKHKSKKFYLVLALFFGFSINLAFFPKEVYAGTPQLQALLDRINSDCKNMNKGSETWKKCTGMEDTLAKWADCSSGNDGGGLFRERSGKWSPNPDKIADCQRKINDDNKVASRFQARLDNIERTCKRVQKTNGAAGQTTDWDKCEDWQEELTFIGCSGEMFEKVGSGGPFSEDEYSYKQKEFNDCKKIISEIRSSKETKPGDGGNGSEDEGDKELTDCDTKLFSPLSWILCPLIDMGTSASDFIFKEIVSPLLEETPVSTNRDDPAYKAWQGFRFLANVMIIGSMLAIVYAQSRGEK